VRHVRGRRTTLLQRYTKDLLELSQRRVAEVAAELVEAMRVARWHQALEVVDQCEGIVEAEALARPRELQQHDRLMVLHCLTDLEQAPWPREEPLRQQQHEHLGLVHALRE
jgi:predicted nucleic acid-binding protein